MPALQGPHELPHNIANAQRLVKHHAFITIRI